MHNKAHDEAVGWVERKSLLLLFGPGGEAPSGGGPAPSYGWGTPLPEPPPRRWRWRSRGVVAFAGHSRARLGQDPEFAKLIIAALL